MKAIRRLVTRFFPAENLLRKQAVEAMVDDWIMQDCPSPVPNQCLAKLRDSLDRGLPVDTILCNTLSHKATHPFLREGIEGNRVTLLTMASRCLFVEGVELLLSRGADPDGLSNKKCQKTPLWAAFYASGFYASGNHYESAVEIANQLLRAGASMDTQSWGELDTSQSFKKGWVSFRDTVLAASFDRAQRWNQGIGLYLATEKNTHLEKVLTGPVASKPSLRL